MESDNMKILRSEVENDRFSDLEMQVFILKEHQSVLETCIRHMGIELESLKYKLK